MSTATILNLVHRRTKSNSPRICESQQNKFGCENTNSLLISFWIRCNSASTYENTAAGSQKEPMSHTGYLLDRKPLRAGHTQRVQPAESTETGRSLCCGVALCTSHVKAVAPSRINVHCLVSCALLSNRRFVPLSVCGGSMPWCHSHWASDMALKFSSLLLHPQSLHSRYVWCHSI